MAKPANLRTAAILWFVSSALALTAALINYFNGDGLDWPLLAATVFTAALGWGTLRRSKSSGG